MALALIAELARAQAEVVAARTVESASASGMARNMLPKGAVPKPNRVPAGSLSLMVMMRFQESNPSRKRYSSPDHAHSAEKPLFIWLNHD